MRISPVFKHFGGKWMAAKAGKYPIPRLGNNFSALPIFEPYAGSAGYSLNHCTSAVTIWEDDPHLASLWQWLINEATEQLILSIPVNLVEGSDIRDIEGLCFGQQLLVKHWQRTNNVGACWTVSAWGNKSGQWTANTRAHVAADVKYIKHWKFERIRYREPGTYYFDPPYFYNYQYRFKTPFDYDQMLYSISLIPKGSRIIVCEATCPKTGAVPDYLPFVKSHRQVTSRRKATQNHHSQELIWTVDT